MRAIIVSLAGLAALALGVGAASAASPTYCALFAKEFVKRTAADRLEGVTRQRVQSRAYHKCLNRDDEPLLPMHYAAPGAAVATDDDAAGDKPPLPPKKAAVQEPKAEAAPANKTASLEPTPKPAAESGEEEPTSTMGRVVDVMRSWWKRPPSVSAQVLGGSGLTMWTPNWERWCKKHFPNSFDPKTGTVVPRDTGVRTRC